MRVALYLFVFHLVFWVTLANAQETGSYRGIAWGSPFPVIEKHFPGVKFIEEDAFHTVIFRLENQGGSVDCIEFKFFEEQLVAVIHYFNKDISSKQNEGYITSVVSGLGPRIEVRKTTARSLAGVADVVFWEYQNNLVLFRFYPPGQEQAFIKKKNSIIFIYKPLFDKMIYHRKHSEGDDDEVVDYDYIEF